MKKLGMALLCLFVLTSSTSGQWERYRVFILPQSELSIRGATNVHEFTCEFEGALGQDTLLMRQLSSLAWDFRSAAMHLSSQSFNCGHSQMNHDLRNLIKSESYPQVILHLLSVQLAHETSTDASVAVNVFLAGSARTLQIPVDYQQTTSALHVSGTLKFRLSDFDLERPTRMLGLVVVEDQVEIDFDIYARVQQL